MRQNSGQEKSLTPYHLFINICLLHQISVHLDTLDWLVG